MLKKCAYLSMILFTWMWTPAAVLGAADAAAWMPPELAALIREGVANNQGLKSQAAKAAGMKAEALAAGLPDDPRIGFGLMNLPVDTFSFSQEPMTQKQITLAQKLPWPGKLSLKSRSAALGAAREAAVLEKKRQELAEMISLTYFDLAVVNKSREINTRLSDMVRRLLRVSETRYAVGKGLQQDVLQAQVELSRLLDEGISLAQERRRLENKIHEMLGRKAAAPVPMTGTPALPDAPLRLEELSSRALERNPGLAIRRIDIKRADTAVALARKDVYPDFDVRFAYGQREEDRMGRDLADFASASVMMRVPLWKNRKQDNRIAAAQKRLLAREAAYRDMAGAVPFQVETLVGEIRSVRETYRLYNDGVLAQAELWAKSAQSAYQVNRIAFDALITAQMRLLRFRLQKEKYLYRACKLQARLEALIGGPMGGPEKDKEDDK